MNQSSRPEPTAPATWSFLSAHGAVLLAVHRAPDAGREAVAEDAGISPRWAIKVLADLHAAGYLRRERAGRRVRYTTNPHRPVRHDVMRDLDLERIVQLLSPTPDPADTNDRLRHGRAELAALRDEIESSLERLEALERRRRELEGALQQALTALRRATAAPSIA